MHRKFRESLHPPELARGEDIKEKNNYILWGAAPANLNHFAGPTCTLDPNQPYLDTFLPYSSAYTPSWCTPQ